MDPEPTQESNRDDSILLGTAYAKDDLMPRTGTVPSMQARLPTLHNEADENQASTNVYYHQSADEPYVFPESQVAQENDPFDLNLPATPAAIMGLNADEMNQPRPRTPQDAKEWLQTAHIALQEARAERDAARQWARDMREAVQKWAEEQRKLIRCETSTRIDALEESERQVRLQTQALVKLESLLQELHNEFQATQSQRQASESHLEQLILDQQERIRELSQQLTSMEQTVSEGMNSQGNRLTPKSELSSQNGFPKFVDRPSSTNSQKSRRSTSSRVRKALPEGNGYVIVYSNGVEKEVHTDGTTVIRFANGDVETTFPGGATVAYLHAAEQVLQVTNKRDGSVLLEYPNGQIERHYANGVKAILFPDGTKAKISADGKVETYHRI
jgi:centromere protein J